MKLWEPTPAPEPETNEEPVKPELEEKKPPARPSGFSQPQPIGD
jgi:hypothetical protein